MTLLCPAEQDGLAASVADRLHLAAAPNLGATGHALSSTGRNSTAFLMLGEVAVAIVGAHMSGLPLNGEITARGGRFVEATNTVPEYHLYALPGGPPERPGLLRSDEGAEIALEVWALPEQAFGSFVASIPPPLRFCTVKLTGRREVKGFLVESVGTVGARDITHHGGWRAYCTGANG